MEGDLELEREMTILHPNIVEAVGIATDLLTRGGWTGAQLDFLNRVASRLKDEKDDLILVEEMRDQRDREEALRR